MKTIRLALVLGSATSVVLAAIGLAACSGDDISSSNDAGNKPDSTTPDSGKDSGPGTDSGGNDGGGDAGADCAAPNKIFNTPDAGPYCPFQVGADGGTVFGSCDQGQHCCVYSISADAGSTCNNQGTACATGVDAGTADFECNENSDCNGNNAVCCLLGTVKQDQTCTDIFYGSKVNGTKCEQNACAGGEVQLCNAADAGCGQGLACRPFKTKSISLGGCVP